VVQLCLQALGKEMNTERAASVAERLCGPAAAVDLALQRGVFSVALEVAVRAAPGEIARVRVRHGEALLRQGNTEQAVALFSKAGRSDKVVDAFAVAGRWEEAEARAGRSAELLAIVANARRGEVASTEAAEAAEAVGEGGPSSAAVERATVEEGKSGEPQEGAADARSIGADCASPWGSNGAGRGEPGGEAAEAGGEDGLQESEGCKSAATENERGGGAGSGADDQEPGADGAALKSAARHQLEREMARALDLERIEVDERPGPAPSSLVNAPVAPAGGPARKRTVVDMLREREDTPRAAAAEEGPPDPAAGGAAPGGAVSPGAAQYNSTIDTCLAMKMGPSKDLRHLEELWEGAVRMVIKHVPERKAEVTTEVTDRLLALGREKKAAQLLLLAGFDKEALRVCIQFKLWRLGEQVAQNLPPELQETLHRAKADAHAEEKANDGAGASSELDDAASEASDAASSSAGRDRARLWGQVRTSGARTPSGVGWPRDLEGGQTRRRQAAQAQAAAAATCIGGIFLAPLGVLALAARAVRDAANSPRTRRAREVVLRLRMAYPLLCAVQIVAMAAIAAPHVRQATFQTVSIVRTDRREEGAEDRAIVMVSPRPRACVCERALARALH
jgi:hypothetical protein